MNDSSPHEPPFFGLSLRLPPSNIDAEQALLGSLLANNRAFERVCDVLEPHHFADPVNGAIYRRIAERIVDGRLADAVTLRSDLEQSGALDEVGGVRYLAELLAAMVGIITASEYALAIRDTWLRRQLIGVGEAVVNNALGEDLALDGLAQIEAAERALAALRGGGVRGDRMMTVGEAVAAAIGQADALYRGGPSPSLLTGMATVDKAFGGLWPGDLQVLAGIPAAGKTALAVQMADRIATRLFAAAMQDGASPKEGQAQPGVVIFELEMSAEQLGTRIAGYRAGVSIEDLLNGRLDLATAARLAQAQHDTAHLPLRIRDCRAVSLGVLSAKIRLHLQRQPERLVVVDHLLVVDDDNAKQRDGGRNAASVARAAQGLKQLAFQHQVPILALSHASRAHVARPNQRPTMQDLKWGGEGDCDTLVFVHRPAMFFDDVEPKKATREGDVAFSERLQTWKEQRAALADVAELVVAKRRMGPSGVHRMRFRGELTCFQELGSANGYDAGGT